MIRKKPRKDDAIEYYSDGEYIDMGKVIHANEKTLFTDNEKLFIWNFSDGFNSLIRIKSWKPQ